MVFLWVPSFFEPKISTSAREIFQDRVQVETFCGVVLCPDYHEENVFVNDFAVPVPVGGSADGGPPGGVAGGQDSLRRRPPLQGGSSRRDGTGKGSRGDAREAPLPRRRGGGGGIRQEGRRVDRPSASRYERGDRRRRRTCRGGWRDAHRVRARDARFRPGLGGLCRNAAGIRYRGGSSCAGSSLWPCSACCFFC